MALPSSVSRASWRVAISSVYRSWPRRNATREPSGESLGSRSGSGVAVSCSHFAAVERKKKQVAAHAQQQLLAGVSPFHAVFAHAAVLPVESAGLGNGHRGFFERLERQQRLFGFRRDVKEHDLAALKVGETLAVGRPNDRRRRPSVALLHHRVDGDGFFWARSEMVRTKQRRIRRGGTCCDCT